jgi:hypothetical protein
MRMEPKYGQILYNYSVANAFKLKPGHDLNIFSVKIMRATEKEIAEHVIGPGKLIPLTVLMLDVHNCQ